VVRRRRLENPRQGRCARVVAPAVPAPAAAAPHAEVADPYADFVLLLDEVSYLHLTEAAHIKLFIGILLYFSNMVHVADGTVRLLRKWEQCDLMALRKPEAGGRSPRGSSSLLQSWGGDGLQPVAPLPRSGQGDGGELGQAGDPAQRRGGPGLHGAPLGVAEQARGRLGPGRGGDRAPPAPAPVLQA
jgi:hypothetical protein